jgi:hypothetical protein
MNIPRSLIRRIRREFRLALKPARRSAQLPVQLHVCGNQFTARAVSDSAAIEFSGDGSFGDLDESVIVSLNDLKKFEAGSREPICIASNENEVVATWTDCGVPQVERFDRLEMPPFPTIAMTPVEVSAELIVALGNAAQCTAETSVRYALDVIKLDGEQGSVVGTDGRQLYKQTGFEFPWREGVLVPSNAWLQGAEFQSQSNIRVAKSDEWLMLQTGDWKLFLKIDSVRRFPDTSQVIPPESELATTLEINRADAQFLQIAIPRLPSANAPDHQVTLDLNGHISLRSRAADSDKATELPGKIGGLDEQSILDLLCSFFLRLSKFKHGSLGHRPAIAKLAHDHRHIRHIEFLTEIADQVDKKLRIFGYRLWCDHVVIALLPVKTRYFIFLIPEIRQGGADFFHHLVIRLPNILGFWPVAGIVSWLAGTWRTEMPVQAVPAPGRLDQQHRLFVEVAQNETEPQLRSDVPSRSVCSVSCVANREPTLQNLVAANLE